MKPPPFSYHAPATLQEAVQLLSTSDNARLLAGGQSLMPMLNMRFVLPDHVIDINGLQELAYIRDTGDALMIGAMTRQRDVEFSEVVRNRCPLLHDAIRQVGHRQTRNRGTVGGSLCQMDPAAEIVAVAAACDAEVLVAGPRGERTIPFEQFPAAYMTPAIEPDEIVTGLRVPHWPAGHGAGFVEFARRHGDFAIVSAAALLDVDPKGMIRRASLTLGGVGPAPVRMRAVEQELTGQAASPELFRRLAEQCRAVEATGDVHAPAEYRQHLATVLSRRALERALSALKESAR